MRTPLFALFVSLPLPALAAAPLALQHQGRLTDTLGQPYEGTVDLTITLYDTNDSEDTGFWSHNFPTQGVDNGYYAVTLDLDDDGDPLDPADFADGTVWVQAFVGTTPMGDRQPLASVPFALIAAGGTASGTLSSDDGQVCLRTRLDANYQEERRRIDCATGNDIDLVQTNGVWAPPSGSMRSCQEYIDAGYYDNEGDGQYVIDPDGTGSNAAITVFCDMTTDGGGWTFAGHVNSNWNAHSNPGLFTNNVGTYSSTRADTNSTYSLGATIMDHIDHQEMMWTVDTASPATAESNGGLVTFRYNRGHTSFHTGPVPCGDAHDLNGFQYRISRDGPYATGGYTNACNGTSFYTRTNESLDYLLLLSGGSTYGVYWGRALGGGNDNWYHDGWFYIR